MFPCRNPFYLRQSSSLLLNSRYVLTAAGVCGFIAFSRPTRPVTSSAYSVAPSARNRKLSWSNKNSALLRSRCPTAEWLARQITEAFPWDRAPTYIVRDNDRAFGHVFIRRIQAIQNGN